MALFFVIPVSRSPERSRGGAGASAEAEPVPNLSEGRDQREAILPGRRDEELLGLYHVGAYEGPVRWSHQ
jgi:hypothetical protein